MKFFAPILIVSFIESRVTRHERRITKNASVAELADAQGLGFTWSLSDGSHFKAAISIPFRLSLSDKAFLAISEIVCQS